jgi:hypothetical protein
MQHVIGFAIMAAIIGYAVFLVTGKWRWGVEVAGVLLAWVLIGLLGVVAADPSLVANGAPEVRVSQQELTNTLLSSIHEQLVEIHTQCAAKP